MKKTLLIEQRQVKPGKHTPASLMSRWQSSGRRQLTNLKPRQDGSCNVDRLVRMGAQCTYSSQCNSYYTCTNANSFTPQHAHTVVAGRAVDSIRGYHVWSEANFCCRLVFAATRLAVRAASQAPISGHLHQHCCKEGTIQTP